MAKRSDRLQGNNRRRDRRAYLNRGYMAGDLPPEKAGPPPKGPMAGFHGRDKTDEEKGGA